MESFILGLLYFYLPDLQLLNSIGFEYLSESFRHIRINYRPIIFIDSLNLQSEKLLLKGYTKKIGLQVESNCENILSLTKLKRWSN